MLRTLPCPRRHTCQRRLVAPSVPSARPPPMLRQPYGARALPLDGAAPSATAALTVGWPAGGAGLACSGHRALHCRAPDDISLSVFRLRHQCHQCPPAADAAISEQPTSSLQGAGRLARNRQNCRCPGAARLTARSLASTARPFGSSSAPCFIPDAYRSERARVRPRLNAPAAPMFAIRPGLRRRPP